MKILKALIVLAILTLEAQAFAAIACGPWMNECPVKPAPVSR